MSCDIKKAFKEQLSKLKSFSIALDESTGASDTAQLAVFLREDDDLQIMLENLTNFHCVIHQQNLFFKSVKFKNVMEIVVGSINFIKSRALNDPQFNEYLDDIFSEYEDVSYYHEVRWLSKGKNAEAFLRFEARNR
ncbi:General transcription factor II-I repeat domain-containing protein 2A [Thelohanellus kitauei]|uniref:General transcription factor II-I repeat domain-containing protein 2A n=1 Tax=Thelohanellus kitauei TaxID=669202 RepID=A0A0C2MXI8_THEKT|nr:General transcription factor II-I repeat domain-containing protein 2A [Thelohanellus kitauei]